MPLEFVDWRSVRQEGLTEPIYSKFYDARVTVESFNEVATSIRTLGSQLSSVCPSPFSRQLETGDLIESSSRMGPTPVDSPLEYLKPVVPHGFETLICPEVECTAPTTTTPTRPALFQSCTVWRHTSASCLPQQAAILEGLEITPADAAALEQNTRLQANSETWKEARAQRVTASSFGLVLKRPTWTDKGLQNFTSQKDLSRVRPIQYGISNEQPAVHRYVSVMKTRGHDVEAFRCGLVVDPSCPWLGASPDRLIFDPSETPMHGLLEVKCPYSQKGKSVSQIEEPFYMVKDHQGIFRLDRSHDYYFQVLGQMALAGLSWTDFAVFSDQFMIVERIRFCEQDWAVATPKLDNFFFSVLLPYLAK
ncbi:hypothetical protein HPB48_002968 [Haemaphysalis longicornis]|uniref:YqaJ viral recombinase domain-containing protein n=1 Tax=Haemaphysalis longicornis TaxID=44386 RepID=A0A9J6FDP7_HAELO|nr:hypothetical protein HPB48_002968 [Haemaphysalis longicornis]